MFNSSEWDKKASPYKGLATGKTRSMTSEGGGGGGKKNVLRRIATKEADELAEALKTASILSGPANVQFTRVKKKRDDCH